MIVDYVKLIWHGAGLAAAIIIDLDALGLDSSTVMDILIIYLVVTVVMALVTEIYLSIICSGKINCFL